MASWLVEPGWDVEFLKPANDKKTPDIKVRMRGMLDISSRFGPIIEVTCHPGRESSHTCWMR